MATEGDWDRYSDDIVVDPLHHIDVDEINERWLELAAVDVWSQLIMKETADGIEQIDVAPRTGQWQLSDDGELSFVRPAHDWHHLQDESECFFLRVYGPGDYLYNGADLGILVSKGRMQTDAPARLTERCQHMIAGIRNVYRSTPLEPAEAPAAPLAALGTSGL